MSLEHALHRMAENVTPSDDVRRSVKSQMFARIRPDSLLATIAETSPTTSQSLSLKERVLRTIRPTLGRDLESLASGLHLAPSVLNALRSAVLSRLQPLREAPVIHVGFKWAATFAVLLLIIRSMPLILLAPATQAEVGVQLVPGGENVSYFAGGVWRDADASQIIRTAVMVSTGDAGATLILNDDGVLRLAPNTTLKLHDIGDRPQFKADGPTATLVRGKVWALGLLPPIVESLLIETSNGTLSLNAGSVSIEDNGQGAVTVAVFNRGATLTNEKQTSFLVAGERSVLKKGVSVFAIEHMSSLALSAEWAQSNLAQDAVHRSDIAKLQEQRRTEVAGILPTSFLYPAKRIAEEVDVLFTLTHDGRTEKRIQQATTRLSEALSLIKEGEDSKASEPLTEYKNSLITLASDQDDNLVKYLIKKQIADASSSLSVSDENPDASITLLRDAVLQIGAAIPHADLRLRDIEGYALVDRLMLINHMLSGAEDPTLAVNEYAEVSPYIEGLLADTGGAHPLLQKEARSLLVTTSSLLKKLPEESASTLFVAMESDVDQYLPAQPEKVLVSEDELNATVQAMVDRIIKPFRHRVSRYNQLLVEMGGIEGNPHRGTLLRRLQRALPYTLGQHVHIEVQKLGDELSDL